MIEILLDTSAYSGLNTGHPEIVSMIRQADRVVVNTVVLGELLAGFRRGKHRKKNEDHLRSFLSSPRVETAALDPETAERYAVILESLRRAGTPIPTNDIWIAANAMRLALPILTTDAHYQNVSQVIVHHVVP